MYERGNNEINNVAQTMEARTKSFIANQLITVGWSYRCQRGGIELLSPMKRQSFG
jgi:hypothetical protein